MMDEMLETFATLSDELGLPADFYEGRTFMHDPLAVYTSTNADLVSVRAMQVQLEIIDNVVRTIPYADRTPNMRVCEQVLASTFVQLWLARVGQFVLAKQ
jgi:inosine-uridine nucleoside N-ribohydrolase